MFDSSGQSLEDPIESQHKEDALEKSREAQSQQDQAQQGEHNAVV